MTLSVGDKVYYPGRGPCLVDAVVKKVVCGTSATFYRLALLADSGAELFVPVANLADVKFRALVSRSEIPQLMHHLKVRVGAVPAPPTAKGWRQREMDKLKLSGSNSAFELADLVETLTRLSGIKPLAFDERETLYRARKLLICEISEVMNESKAAAEARIDSMLESDKNKFDAQPPSEIN